MKMTLANAAKAVKMTKQGLLKAIKDGRLSGKKDANGIWKIDSAELFRVYQPVTRVAETDDSKFSPEYAKVSELIAKLEAASDVRRLLEERIAKVERERDQWQEQAAQLLRALPAGSQDPPPKCGFWRRLFGGAKGRP